MSPRQPRLLARAISEAPDPPCVTHACAQRPHCARQEQACDAFRYWVLTGRPVALGARLRWRPIGQPYVVLDADAAPDPTRATYVCVYPPRSRVGPDHAPAR